MTNAVRTTAPRWTLALGAITFAATFLPALAFSALAAMHHDDLRDDLLPGLVLGLGGTTGAFCLALVAGGGALATGLSAMRSPLPADRLATRLGLAFVGLAVLRALWSQLTW